MHSSRDRKESGPSAIVQESEWLPELERLRREVERLGALSSKDQSVLSAILEHSPHGIILADASGRLVLQNRAAERIWAGSASTSSVQDWGQYRGFHADGRPFAPSDWAMAQCLATGEVIDAREVQILRFDGTRGVLLASSAPLRNQSGKLDGAITVFADVTRMRAAEAEAERLRIAEQRALAELERQRDRQALLAQASHNFVSTLDSKHAVAELARLLAGSLCDCCAVDELTSEGGIRRLALAHADPERAVTIRELSERYPEDPTSERGVAAVLRSGRTEWVPRIDDALLQSISRDPEQLGSLRSLGLRSYAVVPLLARGRVLGALTLLTEAPRALEQDDVKLAEELATRAALALDNARLYESSRRHAETLAQINELGQLVNAELDQQKLVQAVTDAATTLTGAQFGAFFYNVVDEQNESYVLYTISGVPREAFSKFPMPRNTEVFAPTFNGQGVVRVSDITKDPRYGKSAPYHGMPAGHLPVRSYLAVPVVSRTGSVLGGIFLGHERVDVFGESSETLLVGLAAQAAVALEKARLFTDAERLIRKLEQTNRELDQFAYVTSHDLKAPLRGIASLADWIEEDLGSAVTPDAHKKLALLRGRVRRMEALIEGILEFSRAGRVLGKPQELDTKKLVTEVVELLSPRTPARVLVGDGLPQFKAERIPLSQVLMNLISNALKYGGEAAEVSVDAQSTGDFWQFCVRDDGPGIAPAFHERIWGIFQTLQARDKVESTGIGLAIVKKVVEARGGRAWVESEEGRGARFYFTWPKVAATGGVDTR